MATARLIAQGVSFTECPRWHDGRLWFSDLFDHAVKSVDENGVLRTELTLDDQPAGLGWLPDGRLLVAAMKSQKLMRADKDGLHVHADLSKVADHHLNDMVVDAFGRAYLGNCGFDIDAALMRDGAEGVLANHPTTRLARIDPDGSVHIAATDLHFPNGTVITPDGRTLIIAETLALRLTAFDIGLDGSLSNRRVWAPTGKNVCPRRHLSVRKATSGWQSAANRGGVRAVCGARGFWHREPLGMLGAEGNGLLGGRGRPYRAQTRQGHVLAAEVAVGGAAGLSGAAAGRGGAPTGGRRGGWVGRWRGAGARVRPLL